MPLSASTEAIGAVSELLAMQLSARLNNLPVPVGRPSDAQSVEGSRSLNLFLYRIAFDPQLRNTALDQGQPPPLWLVLHYLLTAFDTEHESETTAAHRLLGQGLVALHDMNLLRPPVSLQALTDNPEPLKISFDDADPELLNQLFSSRDEEYRLSAAFQVRPVMLASGQPPALAPLVQSVGPPAAPGVLVLPSMGARLTSITPARFVAGEVVTLRGLDLAGHDHIQFGGHTLLPLAAQPQDRGEVLRFQLPADTPIAAAGYAVSVSRTLPSGHAMSSTPLLGELLPVVSAVAVDGALTPADGALSGSFVVNGAQFGGAEESIFATLFRDGQARLLLEPAAPPSATAVRFSVPPAQALPPGLYRVILRVNGQQAVHAPELDWS